MYFKWLFVAFLFQSALTWAGEFSLGGGLARGDEASTAYTLDLRYSFNPCLSGESYVVKPFVDVGAVVWDNSRDTMYGGVVAVGLHASFNVAKSYSPYASVSMGPALLSSNRFDDRKLGKRLQIRSELALGLTFGETRQHRLGAKFAHFSHGPLYSGHNQGYNYWGLDYGHRF
jgi:hypothetical protein